MTCAPAAFTYRHGFAGDQRFVDRRVPVDDGAVDRDFFAGTHPQALSDGNVGKRNFRLAAIVGDPTRLLGRKIEEGADGARSRGAGAQFENLPEQHQHGDDGGGLEIERNAATRVAEGWRKELRSERGDDAVDVGHTRTQRDQREHVEMAAAQRLGAAHEERPAAPEHHRRRENELHECRRRVR